MMKRILGTLCLLVFSAAASATEAGGYGQQLYCATQQVLSGNTGLLLGMVIALMGALTFFTGSSKAGGIIMIIVGVTITAIPQVYENSLQFLAQATSPLQTNDPTAGDGYVSCSGASNTPSLNGGTNPNPVGSSEGYTPMLSYPQCRHLTGSALHECNTREQTNDISNGVPNIPNAPPAPPIPTSP